MIAHAAVSQQKQHVRRGDEAKDAEHPIEIFEGEIGGDGEMIRQAEVDVRDRARVTDEDDDPRRGFHAHAAREKQRARQDATTVHGVTRKKVPH